MLKKIYIAVFIIIISIPFIGMLFYKTDVLTEKRYLKTFPVIIKNDKLNVNYFDELTDYFSDNFAFRQELTTINSYLMKQIFMVSGNDNVVVGTDNWLYFDETTNDYLGRNVLSRRGIHNCGKVLSLLQENAEKNNCSFLFVAAPNKNSIYPEYMPPNYIKENEANNWVKLQTELNKQNVLYVDLHSAFLKKDTIMYHKYDSHWNNEGAAYACNEILNKFNKKHTDYSNVPHHIENNFSADLWGMLYPKWEKFDKNVDYDKKHCFTYCNNVNSTKDMWIETKSKKGQQTLVMYRDSFGNALLPYLADEYENAFFTKMVPYNWELIKSHKAQNVIIEITERHISSLQEELPIMPASERTLNFNKTVIKNSDTKINLKQLKNNLLIYGTVDAKYTADDSDIYVCMHNNGETTLFEAFPASYEAVVNPDKKDYCFGMYLGEQYIKDGVYKFEIITKTGKNYYSSGIKNEYERDKVNKK